MRFFKLSVVFALFALCVSSLVCAQSYNITDFGIENITAPEGYMVCTMDTCDEAFSKLLEGNNFTFDTWKKQVMIPSNYYVYACSEKDPGKCMYVICEKGEIQETVTNDDGSKSHKHMDDYNLIADGEEKDKFISSMEEALIYQGISKDNITLLRWAQTPEKLTTPYVEYACLTGSDYLHCYETIYDGNKIKIQFSSKNPFTKAETESFANILSAIGYSTNVDYTEVENIINENLQKKLEEETHSGENTKILRYIITVSIAFVIVFAIYMAMRTQKKKRKKTIVLREHEVVEEYQDNDDN